MKKGVARGTTGIRKKGQYQAIGGNVKLEWGTTRPRGSKLRRGLQKQLKGVPSRGVLERTVGCTGDYKRVCDRQNGERAIRASQLDQEQRSEKKSKKSIFPLKEI